VLILFIRRLPYGVRATSAVLRQIKPSIEEAAISLGASPVKAFWKVTVPLMVPGIMAGAMMSFITAINELSSTLLLYTARTTTMPVKVYSAVLDGEFGIAAALVDHPAGELRPVRVRGAAFLAVQGKCVCLILTWCDASPVLRPQFWESRVVDPARRARHRSPRLQ
jgi:hypothetical protein